jgi:hypothetical protein
MTEPTPDEMRRVAAFLSEPMGLHSSAGKLLARADLLEKAMASSTAMPTPKCPWCGQTTHLGLAQCPRVKSMEYHPDGIALKTVEFWPLVPQGCDHKWVSRVKPNSDPVAPAEAETYCEKCFLRHEAVYAR